MREVLEEGCQVDLVRASEMSLSLWPNNCFGAVLARDPALKQPPEVSWGREMHHVCAAEPFVMWIKPPPVPAVFSSCVWEQLCKVAGHKLC